jgi:hypothetical protein
MSTTRTLLRLLAALSALLATSPALAGGGPETVLVVVNVNSPASLQVANHYVKLRGVPATHVCPLDHVPGTGTITVDQFRELIWKPIEAFMDAHGIAEQIDIITYSADFPFGVDYDPDFEGVDLPQGVHKFRVASLTGMTYLIRHVKEKSREYLNLMTNRYCRWEGDGRRAKKALRPARAFRSCHVWDRYSQPEAVEVGADSPDRYYLSTMLGFTGVQGNTVAEIERYLDVGAKSDGTHPKGTVYLMEHKDVRARTRMPYYAETKSELTARGHECKVLKAGESRQDGKVPVMKRDVIGCVAGIASFRWQPSGSSFLPGAIAEHLTSFGARFDGSGQTKISEFLRAGAVGSSGAVAEPYALWMKFPLPFAHVDYADGCCLAEAFYQNVAGPYQLLVIGDPLARPYATFGEVALEAPDPETPWSGEVSVHATLEPAPGKAFAAIELWIDGRRLTTGEPGQPLLLDTAAIGEGAHELRLVALEAGPIETRTSTARWIRVTGAREVTLRAPRGATDHGRAVKLSGRAPGAESVRVLHGHRVVATARTAGSTWKAQVDSDVLGVGTVALRAVATYADGAAVSSSPADVDVEAPAPKSKRRRGKRKGKGGLAAVATDAKGKQHVFTVAVLGHMGKKRFLQEVNGVVRGRVRQLHLQGEFEVDGAGFHQLAFNAAGTLKVKVDGKQVLEDEALVADRQAYVALALSAGWHAIEIDYEPAEEGNGDLQVLLGGAQVAQPLGGSALRH